MTKYKVSANGQGFGVYEADDEQGARDACAVDAGYISEVDMVDQLGAPSELVATEVQPCAEDFADNYFAFIECIDPDGTCVTSHDEFDALPRESRVELAQAVIDANK